MENTADGLRSNRIGLFLIDRNGFFRQGLRAALMQHPEIQVLGESDIDMEAMEIIHATSPQIILLGLDSPALSGIELTRKIGQYLPASSIVVLTSYFNDDEIVQAATAGAAAYLSKDIDATELVRILKRIAQGELILVENLLSRPLVLERILRHFQNFSLKGRTADSMNGPITEREAEVLSYVACGYGNKQIAHALGISEQTIKNHMTSIMSKLGASDRTHAVVMAMQSGWISTSARARQSAAEPTGNWLAR